MTSGWDPAGVIKSQPAGRNEAVQVWMKSQVLRPCVQHGKHTDARTKVAWIGSDLEQGLRGCPKQQVVEEALVPVGSPGTELEFAL